jgi:hypothetical protein
MLCVLEQYNIDVPAGFIGHLRRSITGQIKDPEAAGGGHGTLADGVGGSSG